MSTTKKRHKLKNLIQWIHLFTLNDYQELCAEFTKNGNTVEDFIEAFKFWDSDGSGKIIVEEIRQAYTILGENIPINIIIVKPDIEIIEINLIFYLISFFLFLLQ